MYICIDCMRKRCQTHIIEEHISVAIGAIGCGKACCLDCIKIACSARAGCISEGDWVCIVGRSGQDC